MRVAAAMLLTTLLVAAGATCAGAATARAERLSPAEATWFKPVSTAYGKLATALSVVQKQELAPQALVAGSSDNHALVETLAVFVSCKTWLRQAGKPPTARLGPFLTSMQGACGHFFTGANDIAKAIGAIGKNKSTLAISLLKQGQGELKAGSTLLGQAAKQAIAVGGKAAFKA